MLNLSDEIIEKLERIIELSRHDLVNFRHLLLVNSDTEVEPADFQRTWSDILLNGEENYAVQGYRESGKGQIVLRSFPLHCITFPNPARDYIVIIKNNDSLATAKLDEIETECLSNPTISSRIVKVQKNSANVLSLDLSYDGDKVMNLRIEAYGKGASIRGLSNLDRRPKVIIIDDPQDIEDSRSDTILERDWEWFLSDVYFLGQTCRTFLIGNNLGDKCIIERVFKNAEGLKYKTMRVPEVKPDGTAAWPAKRDINAIMTEKESYARMGKLDIWLREKMCLSTSQETRVFHDEDYGYYSPGLCDTIASNQGNLIEATLDPASSKSIESCFRAIVVNAVTRDNHWYILECLYGRWDSIGLIDQIFYAVKRWGIRRFGIEKGQLQQFLEPILYREMTLRNIRFTIIPLEHGKEGSKLERIKMLQPRFKSHSVWFPDQAPWLTEMKSELAGVTNYEIKSEFIDCVDALAMHEQMNRNPKVVVVSDANKVADSMPRKAIR